MLNWAGEGCGTMGAACHTGQYGHGQQQPASLPETAQSCWLHSGKPTVGVRRARAEHVGHKTFQRMTEGDETTRSSLSLSCCEAVNVGGGSRAPRRDDFCLLWREMKPKLVVLLNLLNIWPRCHCDECGPLIHSTRAASFGPVPTVSALVCAFQQREK